jgi:hypothetical protein
VLPVFVFDLAGAVCQSTLYQPKEHEHEEIGFPICIDPVFIAGAFDGRHAQPGICPTDSDLFHELQHWL